MLKTIQQPLPPVLIDFPFGGRWRAQNSPNRRVPSHGTDLFGLTYAIDFVAVDQRDRSAPRSWRSLLSVEPPEIFEGFGREVLSPVRGRVSATHDGEVDHVARRSQVALVPYALRQGRRVRDGLPALAGNFVAIELEDHGLEGKGLEGKSSEGRGLFVWLAHLRRSSVVCQVGDFVDVGDAIGQCGNSGNSTEPHVHIQITDRMNWRNAKGVPMVFRRYRSVRTGEVNRGSIPDESEVFEVG